MNLILGHGKFYEKCHKHVQSPVPQHAWDNGTEYETLDDEESMKPTYVQDVNKYPWKDVPGDRFDTVIDCISRLSLVYRPLGDRVRTPKTVTPEFEAEIRRILKPGGIFIGHHGITFTK